MPFQDNIQNGVPIPPELPNILKDYVKAAIRTQPYDLIKWSAAYFECLANDEVPPVKDKLEFPPVVIPSRITAGYLRILIKQFEAKGDVVSYEEIKAKWNMLSLNEETLSNITSLGKFEDPVDWQMFIAVSAGYLRKSLTQTMLIICELFSEDMQTGEIGIPLPLFCKLFTFLANLDAGPSDEETCEDNGTSPSHEYIPGIGPPVPPEYIKSVVEYMEQCSEKRAGIVTTDDLWSVECPLLEPRKKIN